MRYDVGRFRRPMRRGAMEQMVSLISLGDGSTLTLDFTTGVLDSRLSFSRSTGGSYVGPDGYLYGFDTSSTSNTIGTGSKTFTLSATAGVNRRYAVGDLIIASSGANNMSGSVTSYDPATQALVCSMASSSGSGTFTTWIIGNRQPRFDHDPTTLAPRGLLVEGTTTNICLNGSMAYTATAPTSWTRGFSGCTVASVDSTTFPGQKAWSISATASGQRDLLEQVISLAANTTYTVSVYLEAVTGTVATFAYMTSLPAGATSNTAFNPSAGRISFTVTVGATAGSGTLRVGIGTASGTGVSADASVRFSHVQVEQGSGASSYIPTGASQGTRNPDECSITGANFSSWFAGVTTGYSMLWSCSPQSRQTGAFPPMVCIRGPSDSGSRSYYYSDGTYNTAHRTSNGTSASDVYGPNSLTYGVARKFAISVTNGTQLVSSNGSTGPANTISFTSFNQTSLGFGNDAGSPLGALTGRQHFQSFKFWPVPQTQAALNALTT